MDDVFARYQAALRTGHQLAAEGRYRDALTRYEEAAAVAGERALPHVLVGGMLLRMSRPREALSAYERALAVEPSNLDALSGRAAALLSAGRRADAAAVQQQIAALRDAPQTSADVPAGLHTPLSRAETMAVAGEQARDAGNRSAAIDAWLAEAREHASDGHLDASLDAALRALTLDTGSLPAHVELARIYAQRGWRDEATDHVAALRRLLELVPDAGASAMLDQIVTHGPPPA